MDAMNRKGSSSSSSSLSRRRRSYISNSCCRGALLCFCISITFFFYSNTLSSPGTRCPFSASPDSCFQESTKVEDWTTSFARRLLGGPGSSPPRCASKCGKCTPCKPVHVPVPPGTPVTAEYYPEAWRCKCGNKLYMP
ncbi:unnamed protein product [Linum trigynum]|uniref:Epidermal patterning factor-like protein n=1 Tax=Linum trigynum TaxID=586398 RepID=A0AAV2D8A7_9ROSI